jgi:hypothetical protein
LTTGLGLGFLLGATLTVGVGSSIPFNADQVVAQVGETTITRGLLAEYCIARTGDYMLENKLKYAAVTEEAARKAGIEVSAEEVQQRIDESKAFVESQEDLRRLEATPVRLLQEDMRAVLLAEKLMKLSISRGEVEDYYMTHPHLFFQPKRLSLTIISTSNRDDIRKAWQRLRDGKDPGEVSATFSESEVLRTNKGLIPKPQARNEMNVLAAEKLFDARNGNGLRKGEFTEVIEFKDSLLQGKSEYMIFYVNEVYPAKQTKLEEAFPRALYLARVEKCNKMWGDWYREETKDVTWKRLNDLFNPLGQLEEMPVRIAPER